MYIDEVANIQNIHASGHSVLGLAEGFQRSEISRTHSSPYDKSYLGGMNVANTRTLYDRNDGQQIGFRKNIRNQIRTLVRRCNCR